MLTVNIVENHIEIQYQDYIDDNLEIQYIFQRNKIQEQLTAKCSFITSISTIFDMILKRSQTNLIYFERKNKNVHISSMHQYIANHCIEIVYLNIVSELKTNFPQTILFE